MMGGARGQDLSQPLGYLFEESPDSLGRVMIGRFSGRKNYSEFMKIRTLDGRVLDVRFHRHVARMIKSAESFSGQAASVETTISLRARRGCQRRYTGPQAVARRRRAVLRSEERPVGKEGVRTGGSRGVAD